MRGSDVIRSNSGTAYIKVDAKVEEMFYVKSIEATIKKKKTEVPVLGKRMVSHKTGQLKGKGKMTIYYVTPMFRKMTESFKNTGRDTFTAGMKGFFVFGGALLSRNPCAASQLLFFVVDELVLSLCNRSLHFGRKNKTGEMRRASRHPAIEGERG